MRTRWIIRPLAFSLLVVALAGVAGWQNYLANPKGMLLYTPNGPCPSMAHSFGLAFWLVLALAGGLCLLVALAACTLDKLNHAAAPSTKRSGFIKASLVSVVLMALSSVLVVPLEYALPLQTVPGCPVPSH